MGKIISGRQIITDKEHKWMHIIENDNFTKAPVSYLYKCVFNDTIYSITPMNVTPFAVIDWNVFKLPPHYRNKGYNNIAEFFQDIKNKKYIFCILGFHSTDEHLSFGFRLNQDYYLAFFSWRTGDIKIINKIENIYSINGVKVPIQYETLPQASDSEYFYSIIEPYYLREICKDKKDIPMFFRDIDVEDNPIIIKYKYKT